MNHDQPQVNNDVADAEAKAEGQKLEWGPEISKSGFWSGFSIEEALSQIDNLNSHLNEGEKKWRLPTADELAEIHGTDGFSKKELPYWTNETKIVDNGGTYPVVYKPRSKDKHSAGPEVDAYLKPCR